MDYRILSAVLGLVCLGILFWDFRLRNANVVLQAEVDALSEQLEEAFQRLAQAETQQKSKTFARVVDALVAAGVPSLVLLGAMAVSGFSGAAAITVALAAIGGPAGMFGGIGVLVSLGVVIAKYGISDLSIAVVNKILESRSPGRIIQEIDALPKVIPQKFRLKAKSMLTHHGK